MRARPDDPRLSLRKPAGREILRRFTGLTGGTRLFLFLRWLWTPYVEMASRMPARGKILDAGSGHGLFSLALALQSPGRRVEGVDHSSSRVSIARKAAAGLDNLTFRTGDFRLLPRKSHFDGIAFVDVLHYLPYRVQDRLFRESFRRLRPGGTLLFREVDRTPGLASWANRLHETLMTGLGFTKAGGLHFRSAPEWKRLAEEAGFTVGFKPTGRFPFADVLFWGRKS